MGIEDPLILLDKGFNAFTAVTDDVEGLVLDLESRGVKVTQVNRLDKHEPVPPEVDLLLPGESLEDLLPILRPSEEADE